MKGLTERQKHFLSCVEEGHDGESGYYEWGRSTWNYGSYSAGESIAKALVKKGYLDLEKPTEIRNRYFINEKGRQILAEKPNT